MQLFIIIYYPEHQQSGLLQLEIKLAFLSFAFRNQVRYWLDKEKRNYGIIVQMGWSIPQRLLQLSFCLSFIFNITFNIQANSLFANYQWHKLVYYFWLLMYKCLKTNPAFNLADNTDLLIVVDHLLTRVVICYYQVPGYTGAEMLPRSDTFSPFIFKWHSYLNPTFSIVSQSEKNVFLLDSSRPLK